MCEYEMLLPDRLRIAKRWTRRFDQIERLCSWLTRKFSPPAGADIRFGSPRVYQFSFADRLLGWKSENVTKVMIQGDEHSILIRANPEQIVVGRSEKVLISDRHHIVTGINQ
jgi:hypothetical protein